MAPSYDPKLRPNVSNSTSIFGAIIKHIAADNPTQLADATGRLLTWAFEHYIITPLSSGAFIMTCLVISVWIILLDSMLFARPRALRRRLENQIKSRQIREEQVQREYEEQLQREEAEWQTRKDEIIRHRPNDAESLEYISGQPEEF